ncbi:UNVERIFIED_CONTAM: hypothetical protein FKN15_014382 [Acipenser sinensis]
MAKQYDVLFRLLLLGDSGVGKTCLLCRFTDNEFHSSHISTIGVDFKMKTVEVDGIKVRIQIWVPDEMLALYNISGNMSIKVGCYVCFFLILPSFRDTAGQERYQTITKQYYRRAQGIFLVYDITSERSFQHIMKWASDVDELAKEYGMDFFETSACTNYNIKESFTRLTELVLQAHKKELDVLRVSINDELSIADLEGEEGKGDGSGNSQKACWC